MKSFKKLIAAVMTAAMVLGIVGMMPVAEAKAATITTAAVTGLSFTTATNLLTATFNSTTGEGAAKAATGNVAYLQVGEVKANGKIDYNTYEVTLATVDSKVVAVLDLSAYMKKDVKLSVRNGETDAKEITLKKNTTKLKVTLALDETKAVDRFVVKNGAESFSGTVQWRIGGDSSAWTTLEAGSSNAGENALQAALSKVEQFGATILFRALGADGTTEGTFSTAETKVKYPKLGKAPKITVDYVKNTVKFPKDIQVINMSANAGTDGTIAAASTTWANLEVAAGVAATISIDKLVPAPTANTTPAPEFTFYARTVAKDKKPSSSVAAVKIEGQTAAKTTDDEFKNADKLIISIVPKSATDPTVKGIKVENKTGKDIEYILEGATSQKWTKIVSGGSKIINGTTSTLDTKKLTVRYAGKAATASDNPVRASAESQITISAKLATAISTAKLEQSSTAGSTKLTATATDSGTLYYKVFDSSVIVPYYGDAWVASMGTALSSGAADIAVSAGKYVAVYEVKTVNSVSTIVGFKLLTVSAGQIKPATT